MLIHAIDYQSFHSGNNIQIQISSDRGSRAKNKLLVPADHCHCLSLSVEFNDLKIRVF